MEFHKAEAERLKALVNSVNLGEVVERSRCGGGGSPMGYWILLDTDGWVGIRELENENALLTRALVEGSRGVEERPEECEWVTIL